MVKARANFGDTVARAGLTRQQLATASGVSVRTIDALANPRGAGRNGMARNLTAWRIANGFAAKTGLTPDGAYAALFEPAEESVGNRSPAQAAAKAA